MDNVSDASGSSSRISLLEQLVASGKPASTSYWTPAHIEAFKVVVHKMRSLVTRSMSRETVVEDAVTEMIEDISGLDDLLQNVKNKCEYEIRGICRATNSEHFTGFMVALEEILQTLRKDKVGLHGDGKGGPGSMAAGSLGGRARSGRKDDDLVSLQIPRISYSHLFFTFCKRSSSSDVSSIISVAASSTTVSLLIDLVTKPRII
jgi:hypothetical protein